MQDVIFRVDYTVAAINREFGSVFLGDTNLALAVVGEGWAKVSEPTPSAYELIKKVLTLFYLGDFSWFYPVDLKVRPQIGQNTTEVSPFLAELEQLEEQAKLKGIGIWNKVSVFQALQFRFEV